MGIRQHLLALEKKGLVTNAPKRRGIGRPKFEYRLTEKAEKIFPKQYDFFVLRLLETIEKKEGRKKVNQIFGWLKEGFIQKLSANINHTSPLEEKVINMVNTLRQEGYLSELQEDRKYFYIKNYNCPISSIAHKYRESCSMELEMYREIFGNSVKRTECQVEGAISCTYQIPKNVA
jgi:predicted ArsR family transcriptional regulator